MDGPGRPSLYEPEFAEQAFELCLAGATNQDLADTFEVGHSTIDNWLKKHPEFAQSVKRGRALADGRVAHGLYSRAIGYTYETTRVVLHRGEPV
ncbi:MAG TPA: transposase, partial [Reyranella sp.]|nr:transposase [Reyranella sp.]